MNNHGELENMPIFRARVTGQKGELGWLVVARTSNGPSITFVEDADGIWDGMPYLSHEHLPPTASEDTNG